MLDEPRDDTEFYVPRPEKTAAWNKSSMTKSAIPWGRFFFIGLLLFTGQLIYFEGYTLTQSRLVRPWLQKLCEKMDCQLPVYYNINEFDVLHSSFQESAAQAYDFQAAINNQSVFAQAYPKIKLTLVDFSGKPLVKRVFLAQDYLNASFGSSLVSSNETFEVKLQITTPNKQIGGYSIEII
jgi:hypothetical protein